MYLSLPVALYTLQPDFQELILSLRKGHIDSAQISMGYVNHRAELGLRENFEKLSNTTKREALADTGAGDSRILQVLDLSAKRNTVMLFAVSLRSAASGMRGYKNFCDFTGRPPFPVDADAILLWSGLFRPGKTFGLYLPHVMKAAILLRYPTGLLTPAVRAAARGLRKAAGSSFKSENYIIASDLLVLTRQVKLASEFGQAAFFADLFLLRVPSEALQMRMADSSGAITEFAPQKLKVLAGARTIKGADVMVAKFPWRKNVRRGCILRRPCICGESTTMARVLCPVHCVWPLIRDRDPCHGYLFTGFSTAKFNRELKRTMGFADSRRARNTRPMPFGEAPRKNCNRQRPRRTLSKQQADGGAWVSDLTWIPRWRAR